ncbi:MAG TPA: Xaa-Pro peptidase family protein [Gemmatimonadales bacterium]|jgi:Xaa-Pro dipeptidase|nr:Xaa-Pro peptidase family protein [Gemmatimonadales bacterium]
MNRRHFTRLVAASAGAAALGPPSLQAAAGPESDPCSMPASILALKPLLGSVPPIGDAERRARIDHARRLMTEHGIGAVVVEPGSGMHYFTGVDWGLSERPFIAVLPVRGELAFVAPGFEEARARELIRLTDDVRVWQEDESPYRVIAGILRDRGVAGGRVGIEERMRFFIADGLRRETVGTEFVPADVVTTGCRAIKSPAELALLQRANDVTTAAFRAVLTTLAEGMTQRELEHRMRAALERLGGTDPWALAGFGQYSAFPHGTIRPQQLRRGDIVLVDAGCAVEHYQADVTRTTVFGKPTRRQVEIWELERRAQDAAFRAAQVGATCASVDAAARKVITDAGFGPDYKVPGTPHRTGHGIGLDVHEAPNFVRGNQTVLAPGMCFSDEPTIVIYGEFGIRLEDCLHITEAGPRFFTQQSPAIDRPFP